ncbi:flagellin [Roseivivax lentus]|uniref:Flagellin n=1 Tax=Roseivivax lentus TaxID=633194 RepID=A0A1N7JL29_9RHOB|nr:flagellin [Roseivivax lentus]SIS49961.1 flagellin [Roseivivax lentus]
MSSILTNNGAMVALQTLKSINRNLAETQSQISTGKSVANAKDNAAVWAISKVMESDVQGFKGISDSLNLGESTVAVARQASETVADLLTQMKGKIVAAQEENVDRAKIQTDIAALRDQITSVTNAAQFNGLNLLSNTEKEAGSGLVNVLSSLDRSSTGVTASNIAVNKQDLGTGASAVSGTAITTAETATATNSRMTGTALAATTLTGAATAPTTSITISSVEAGFGYSAALTGGAGAFATGWNVTGTAADGIRYVARDGDTTADVAQGLADSFNKYAEAFEAANPGVAGLDGVRATVSGTTITFTGSTETGDNFGIQVSGYGAAGNTIGGGLEDVSGIDVTTDAGVTSALSSIESLIQTSIDSAAAFGSVQGRIETQATFIQSLSDSLKSGIGTLVDADMEEASARLQALQVQQQLGVQALSIANQAPQSLLSLFR